MLQAISYTIANAKHNLSKKWHVGKTKHVVNRKLHCWQNETCCKQEVTQLAKQNML